MSDDLSFADLIRRVRAGDQQAAADLVRHYEPVVRRAVRFRLGTRLAPVLDSLDVCQSVLASFFVRAASGQYDLDTPEQLLKLLTAMVRHKVAGQVRHHRRVRRDHRRVAGGAEAADVPAPGASPGGQAAARELLGEVQRRLTPEDRLLVELRNQGLDWAAIASRLGGTPDGRRMQLARALDEVARQLGLDEDGHE
jgi:RNA polymerase sigma-70 factor (ECF subfamily)